MKREPVDVKHEPEQLRKMFIGGLDYSTTDEGLKAYYEKWGTVVDVVVMKDPKTRRSRGFGFITYSKASMVDEAMNNRPHKIDGRQVEPKRAVPRDLCSKGEANVRKLFIGGIGKQTTKEDLEDYFKKFGTLTDCAIVVTKDTGEPRGFGFVEYEDVDSADKVILMRNHEIKGRKIEIKKAIARDEINKDARRSGGGGGIGGGSCGRGMRDGRGGNDFRIGQKNFGCWNSQGNNWGVNSPSPWNNQQGPPVNNWSGNNFWGNNSCWGNNQNNFSENVNDTGNNIGGNLGNMGGQLNNYNNNNNNNNNNNSINNNNNYNNNNNNNSNNNNNLGGGIGNLCNNMGNLGNLSGVGRMGLNNLSSNINNGNTFTGMGGYGNTSTLYNSNIGGNSTSGFYNFGGPSSGGPMRGGFGTSNIRLTPYPTSGRINVKRFKDMRQHLKFYRKKSGGR